MGRASPRIGPDPSGAPLVQSFAIRLLSASPTEILDRRVEIGTVKTDS
jgi:hypothetical protein